MKINPMIGVAVGLIALVVGLVTHLITLDIAGPTIAILSASRIIRDRRGSGGFRS